MAEALLHHREQEGYSIIRITCSGHPRKYDYSIISTQDGFLVTRCSLTRDLQPGDGVLAVQA